jgi:pimeloyl-ACP methyl ester carboxylesterase
MVPETRYARSGNVSIAYQVFGDGPFEIVFSAPASSHVELAWEAPIYRGLFERLSSFARVVSYDKRGVGMSDRSGGYASPETRMDDIRAVMDAAGSERAAIVGWSEGVRLSALFAATYPDRAWALVACGGSAGKRRSPDEKEAARRLLADERAARERNPIGATLRDVREGSPDATDEELEALARMHAVRPQSR